MKRSFITAIFLISIFSLLLCSTYSIKTDIENTQILSKINNIGIIFRVSKNSKITKEELIKNFQYWLSVYKKNKNITIINNANYTIAGFKDPQERFYQLSNENTYLKYKSIGVVNKYLQTNQNELHSIIEKNNLDGLLIFEVFTVISTELQFIEFESVLAILDSDLNIAYLDHQTNNFESESSVLNDLMNQIADKINCRLTDNMQSQNLNILGGQIEGEIKIEKSGEDKKIKKAVEKPLLKSAEKPAVESAEKPAVEAAEKSKDKFNEMLEEIKTRGKTSDNKPELSPDSTPSQETKTKDASSPEKPAPEK